MIANKDEVLPKENKHGVDKVKTEDYAFLMESSSIEYILYNIYIYCINIWYYTYICILFYMCNVYIYIQNVSLKTFSRDILGTNKDIKTQFGENIE